MGEPGVSKIVSVKVNDQASVRSESRAPNTLQGKSTAPEEIAAESNEVAVA